MGNWRGKNKNKGGRGGRGGSRGGRGGGGSGGGPARYRDERTPAQQIRRDHKNLESYYNALGVVDETESHEFWRALKTDLPNSFRFAGSKGHALAVQKSLIDYYIPQIEGTIFMGEPVEPPKQVPWIPSGLAYEMTTSKNVIRKQPQFASFQKFLVSENSVGNITRQELVSMIPPLFMDIKPSMVCLDMCAAPGSKSAQIIEMIHDGEETRTRKALTEAARREGRAISPGGAEVQENPNDSEVDHSDSGRPTGLLVANDADYKRAQMLVHQTKRLNSPNVIVTNHDATLLPSIKAPGGNNTYLKFDRILADVPCSGDGTLRKNLAIWRDWTPASAIGLHKTQTDILVRALQLLKVGGRVVYSTCSMNPVENEAVITHSLKRVGGLENVSIVDVSSQLPDLKRKPGLKEWKVMDASMKWWSNWAEVDAAQKAGNTGAVSKIHEGMFPAPELELPLERCVRVYAHLQNTGGFFITVLEKKKEIRAKPASAPPKQGTIGSIVKEIEQRDVSGGEHIKALDQIAPGSGKAPELSNDNEPAAARQNQENTPETVAGVKRPAPEDVPSDADQKRLKTTESGVEDSSDTLAGSVEDAVASGAANGVATREHWPPPPASNPSSTQLRQERLDKKAANQPHEEPFKYLPPDHPELEVIYKYYNLSPSFPRDRFMVRNATGEPAKAIYYTSSLARDLLQANESKGIKFVHCGVRMFVKQDVQGREEVCKWRIQTEGLPIVEGWVGEERVIRLHEPKVLQLLLREMFPRVSGDEYKRFGELGERLRTLGMGCAILRCEPHDADGNAIPNGFDERLALPVWRGISSINLMLPKEERKAMLLRMFKDDSALVDHSQQDRDERMKARQDKELEDATREAEAEGENASPNQFAKGRTGQDFEGTDEHMAVAIDDAMAAGESAVIGEVQNVNDQSRETAPGIDDEDERVNKTV